MQRIVGAAFTVSLVGSMFVSLFLARRKLMVRSIHQIHSEDSISDGDQCAPQKFCHTDEGEAVIALNHPNASKHSLVKLLYEFLVHDNRYR